MRQSRFVSIAAGLSGLAAFPALAADLQAGPLSPTSLYLRAGTVDTSRPVGDLAGQIGQHPAGTRFVVQLDGPITPQRRARMAAAGIQIGDYLPSYAYLVSLDRADARAVAALEFIRWYSPWQAAWKLDPELGARTYVTPTARAILDAGRLPVVVLPFALADAGAIEKAIWAIPGAVVAGNGDLGDRTELLAEVPPASIPQLATIPGVQFIEPAPEATLRNSTTRWIVQSNVPNVTPLYANGLRGEGQVIGILDSEVDQNHCSFRDTANPVGPLHRKILAYNQPPGAGGHGTHVAGIAVGDNGDNTDTRGVAYMGKLVYNDYFSGGLPTESQMMALLNTHHTQGARVHTNSWGNDFTVSYDGLCRAIDNFSYQNQDDLVLFAVTNMSALKNPENAKNLVAVGNSGDTPQQGTFCTGGEGPTSDGRRKPEIWAPGCNSMAASAGSSCGVVGNTGTSMACPAVAGVSMLVRQYFTAGYYPTGAPQTSDAFTPTGALVKAVILNSGQDMPAGAGYPGPREGWGRVLADHSLFFPGDARKLRIAEVRNEAGLATNQSVDVPFTVTGSGEQLRATVVWTEPPAAAGAAAAAVNNLDVEVHAPSGAVYKGNVFSGGVSVVGGAADDRNNVEQVHLSNPGPGQYVLRIKGTNVAVGAQGYAAVISGDIAPPQPGPLYISLVSTIPTLLAPGTPLDVDVRIISGTQNYVPGSGRMHYRMSASGGFSQVTLSPQGGDLFRATLPAASCGDVPQFYFTAAGDQGANVAYPANAPTSVLSTTVGSINVATVMEQGFESGLPAGWSVTGLWHVSQACAPTGTCAQGGTRWAYYGQDANCTFNTGTSANLGRLTSAPIALPAVPAGGLIELSFCSAKISEDSPGWDESKVFVNNVEVLDVGESPDWEVRTVDLSAYAGQNVTLAFEFDTGDGQFNNYRGWHVDNVKVTAQTAGCGNPPPTCYANCDGSTVAPVLNVQDFTCFLQRYAAGESYANCDNSTTQPVLNVQDFTCFLQRYAQGCP